MTRIGSLFHPYANCPEELRAAVLAAERVGLAELWLWEDCFRESAFASAGAALAWTTDLKIGIGISPMPLRNAALTAMEIATLERMFPGRLMPGLGHGVLPWMEQVGARVSSPLTLMAEYVPAVRALLAGEEVTSRGRYVGLDRVRLDWVPNSAPRVYAGAEGPKTLALSGASADGTVLVGGRTPVEIAKSVQRIERGRAEADRPWDHDIVAFAIAEFGPDAGPRAMEELARGGIAQERGRVLLGGPSDVAAQASQYFAAGVDSLVLQPVLDEPDLEAFYSHVAEVARLIPAKA